MSPLTDDDSYSFICDPCSDEDRSNASHQRRDAVEGQSYKTEAPSTRVEKRAYNLRPRKDDPVTMQRRLEFARLREQQNQRRNKRKEAETTIQEITEYFQYLSNKQQKFVEEPPESSDDDSDIRTEVITGDTGSMNTGVWRPYFELSDIGIFKTTLKGASWAVEKLALQAAPSVVGLQSFTGNTYLFSCSGTIFEFFEESGMIVTVANLVKCTDSDKVADELKIDVYLQNHAKFEGHLLYYDFYHNISVIRICSPVHLQEKSFSSNIRAIDIDKSCSSGVVTLGRDKGTHDLLVTIGKLIPKGSKFDCEELLVSTCRISKVEVGGPLMNFDGNIIGMNYYHTKDTPFIPSFIVLKCLQQFKLFGKVVRPWHGLRVRTLDAEGCIALEKTQTNFGGATGVIIEKIKEHSSAEVSGLNEGDIINRVNGVYFSSAAELGGILLDIGTTYLLDHPNFRQSDDSEKMALCIKFGVRGCERERTIVVEAPTSSGLNRWPFPKLIIVRTTVLGRLQDEKWYAVESSRESSPTDSSGDEGHVWF